MSELIKRETLSKRLKEIRESTGLSIRKFAEKIGVQFTVYFRAESGDTKKVGVNIIKPIVELYGINAGWLIDEDCTRKYRRSETGAKCSRELTEIIDNLDDEKLQTLLKIAKALKGE